VFEVEESMSGIHAELRAQFEALTEIKPEVEL
jgi:hypothetical protein